MSDTTNISWTDSTFNIQIGCTKTSPGCDNCYAEEIDNRFGGQHWGKGNLPRSLSDSYWKHPLRWQRKAAKTGVPHRVFLGSMCDWCNKNTPADIHERMWSMIRQTPMLRWQLLTKRAPNITKYLPPDWGDGYENVWLGVSVENRKHGLPRIDRLRNIPAKCRFLSIEPLLDDLGVINLTNIHWVIVGGESGRKARPMDPAWVDNIYKQCRAKGIPFFFKQWGGRKDKGGSLIYGTEIKEFPPFL